MTKSVDQKVKDLVGAPLRMVLLPDEMSTRLGLTSLEDERLSAVRPWISGRLLDVGAGRNRLVREYGDGVGVDVVDLGGGARVVPDSTTLPFLDGSFDTVTFVASLNHIPERQRALREAWRVLRDNGRIVVTMIDPVLSRIGHGIWWYSEDKHRGGMRPGETYGFWPREIRSFMEAAGFLIVAERRFVYGLNRVYVGAKRVDDGELRKSSVTRGNEVERTQRSHYDSIASTYGAHYSDPTSDQYRNRFLNDALTRDVPLQGRRVLEAFCGAGSTTGYLLKHGAHVTGLDISSEQMALFRRRWPHAEAVQASILGSGLSAESFDVVVVVGGLHHVQPRVQEAIDEIWKILRPGGFLCFAEPHQQSVPDMIRRRWYKLDRLFERDERSIDLRELENRNKDRFEFVGKRYGGNLAYLLVLNSLIFRIPVSWKRYYAPAALTIEAALSPLQNRWLSCFVTCRWRKKGSNGKELQTVKGSLG